MKKITLLTAFLISFVGFSQANKEIIQNYFDDNQSKLSISKQDISDWNIESEVTGSGTKITSCYIVQHYKGIEIFNAQSNVSIKNGKVINIGDNFKKDISQKVNSTIPTSTASEAFQKVYAELGYKINSKFTAIETKSPNKFKVSDGVQKKPIDAKLVYQYTSDDKLKLAWSFMFYSPDGDHLWSIRIDAVNGKILEKNDLTLSCNFGEHNSGKHNHTNTFNFAKSFYKNNNAIPAIPPSGSYKVIPYNYVSPDHSPFQLITTAGQPLASPNGWHDTNAVGGTDPLLKYTITRGNNVIAQEDALGINQQPNPGFSPDGGVGLNFDFPYCGFTQNPSGCTSSAATNLFYSVNVAHDIWYQYGFNEESGNFQANNYGKGGLDDDYVLADAQDGYANATTPRLNNANFSTPPDNGNPRMQMFLWDSGIASNNFNINSTSLLGSYVATDNSFSPGKVALPAAPSFLTADLVLYDDGTTTNIACVPALNAAQLSGKIAVLRRGTCNFVIKVKNAQNAGAIGVIVVNSVEEGPRNMGGGDATITIPAVCITKAFGESIILKMQTETVNVSLQAPKLTYIDGDFDNGIINHEFGHGISNRLIGGPLNTSCMTNYEQMGEGWSDWFSLMTQLKTGDAGTDSKTIGTFVIKQPTTGAGIRALPYSTNISVDTRTLTNSNTPIPPVPAPGQPQNTSYRYVVGEVWTSVMWDLTWAYINKYGYDSNIYTGTGGNNKIMRLVLDALKLQACNQASIINGRDNIIAADQATTGGQDYCLITEVFRRRGMGLNATSGSANDCNDQVADFTAFPAGSNCVLGVSYFKNDDMVSVYPNPSNGEINIKINQYNGKVNLQVVDLNGRVVYSLNNTDFNVEKSINLKSLQSGMYIVKINGEELNYTKKIILN
ncbi:T9SS-dependent M36 family metallopeptidase [Flavobacterium sp.]|uniref:T9SS-dependent M36 family metallopeptidase n=1 Tax=Flavobacterium sp. TaxID=239 RepID=UPI00375192EF